MAMSVPRSSSPPFGASRDRRGFSLVELLVVILIMAIIFVVGGMQVSQAWKRQKVQSAANDIKILMQRALPEVQRRNMVTFVRVGPYVTNSGVSYLPIYLVGDANGNGTLDAFANPPTVANPDLLIDEYDVMVVGKTGVKGQTGVSQEFSLSEADVTQVRSSRWTSAAIPCAAAVTPFCDSKDRTVARALECDFQGRALDVTTGRQIAGSAMLVFAHTGVVDGSLLPPTRYVLSINPVWSVRIQKQIKDSTGTWVDQQGG